MWPPAAPAQELGEDARDHSAINDKLIGEGDHELEVEYYPLPDNGFGETEAWRQDMRTVAWVLARRIWGVNEFLKRNRG